MPGTSNHQSLVRTYVDAALLQLKDLDLDFFPGRLPVEMRDLNRPSKNDWQPWSAIPSTVTDREIAALEATCGLSFPPPYRELLKYRHFVELTEQGLRFERHIYGQWSKCLAALYTSYGEVLSLGLLPFGHESFMDAGPVCFDFRTSKKLEDPPVVFWDHEMVGTDCEIRPLFSSVSAMFRCLTVIAESRGDIELDRFFEADPSGAGAEASEHWMLLASEPDDPRNR